MANKTWLGLSTPGDYGVAANWSGAAVPVAGDNVHLPAGSPPITASLNQSAVALASFVSEQGFTSPVASAAAYLQINTAILRWNGLGTAYIDLGSSTVSPDILATATPGTGTHGLYLKGTAIGVINLVGGDVGLGAIFGETATATTVRSVGSGASITIGALVTLTNFYQTAGDSDVHCGGTAVTCYGGTLNLWDAGAWTDVTVEGGNVFPNSNGTISSFVANGGTTDWTGSGESRAVTAMQVNEGATVIYDPAVLSIGTWSPPSGPVMVLVQSP